MMKDEVKYVDGNVVEDMLRQYNDGGECYGEVRIRWFGFDGKDNANVVTREIIRNLTSQTEEWEQVRKQAGKS
jgi:hypothetical protein